jgi:hypothetical protein
MHRRFMKLRGTRDYEVLTPAAFWLVLNMRLRSFARKFSLESRKE